MENKHTHSKRIRLRRARLKKEFLAFDGSLVDFARRKGYGESLIRKYSAEDGWVEAKRQWIEQGRDKPSVEQPPPDEARSMPAGRLRDLIGSSVDEAAPAAPAAQAEPKPKPERKRRIRERLLAGELSIADALRLDTPESIASLMAIRDNVNAPAAAQQNAALRLAEMAGVVAIRQDLESRQVHEPLADAEVNELFMWCRKIKGLRAKGVDKAHALMHPERDGTGGPASNEGGPLPGA